MFIESDSSIAPELAPGETRGAAISVKENVRAFVAKRGAHAEGDVVHLFGLKRVTDGRNGWLKTDNGKWRVQYEASSVTLPDDESYFVVEAVQA